MASPVMFAAINFFSNPENLTARPISTPTSRRMLEGYSSKPENLTARPISTPTSRRMLETYENVPTVQKTATFAIVPNGAGKDTFRGNVRSGLDDAGTGLSIATLLRALSVATGGIGTRALLCFRRLFSL